MFCIVSTIYRFFLFSQAKFPIVDVFWYFGIGRRFNCRANQTGAALFQVLEDSQ
jgi:hypothetical protein